MSESTEDWLATAQTEADKKTRKERSDVGRKRGPRRPKVSVENLKDELQGGLALVNTFLANTKLRLYAMAEEEIIALADALADEITNNPKVLKFFVRVGAISPHIKLAHVVVAMGVRRYMVYQMLKEHGEAPQSESETPHDLPFRIPTGTAINA